MRWGGGLPLGIKKFVPSPDPMECKHVGWDIPGVLPGYLDPLGVLEKYVQKCCAHFLGPMDVPNHGKYATRISRVTPHQLVTKL